MAMVFTPFATVREHYRDVSEFLESQGILASSKVVLTMPYVHPYIHELHAYVGSGSPNELTSFRHFVDNNGLQNQLGVRLQWVYEKVVLVAMHGDVVVDVPLSMFPLPLQMDDHLDQPAMFTSPVSEDYVSTHRLAAACARCHMSQIRCTALEGLVCPGCCPDHCKPSTLEDGARAAACYHAAAKYFFALTPPFQHLIQCVKTVCGYNGEPKMPASTRRSLVQLVRAEYLHGNQELAIKLINASDAFQRVRFLNGVMTVEAEVGTTNQYRFEHYRGKGEDRARCAVPHFGIAEYYNAYSLINSALSNPGAVYCFEGSIMHKGGEVRDTRIFVNACVWEDYDIRFIVGWKYKK
jgi:hypothetical protein